MQQPQKRQYLIVVILLAIILACGSYIWQQKQVAPAVVAPSAPTVLTDTPTAGSEIVVYVSGFVIRPGVYKLSGEPRVVDVVNAAGGFATGANAQGINLAQKLADGMQIHVSGNLSPNSINSPGGQTAGKVSLNSADQKQLESLPGIGPALAGRIIEYRTAQGGFKAVEELKKVSGIGDAKFNSLKDRISL